MVSALLLQHHYRTQTHNGVRTLFFQYFVKTGKVALDQGYFYTQLFDRRQAGDYVDFTDYDKEDIAPLITPTHDFLQTIKALVNA